MTLIITPMPADFTAQRDALELLLTRIYDTDYAEHPDREAFARIRDAVAASDPARHKTRTANSAVRSEKFTRHGSLVYGDESFAECVCGWTWHDSTRAQCRSAARAHREEATRLILDQHAVAALWCVLSDRWTPLACWDALDAITPLLATELRSVAYHQALGRA